jgi:molybdopterin converting factor small subunit
MKTIRIQYFAALRELAHRSTETLQSDADTAAQLYGELLERYRFTLDPDQIRVVINDEFGDWTTVLSDGDDVVFLPPVAGG